MFSPRFRAQFGALYEDIQNSDAVLYITAFHNVRLFVLILVLVVTPAHPLFQSTFYLCSAVLSAGWDLTLAPYDGRTLKAQMYFLDAGKVAAAAGYVMLTVSGVTEETARWMRGYEVVALLAAMGGGLVLATAQQSMAIAGQIREMCRKRIDEKVFGSSMIVRADSFPSSQNTVDFKQ